MFRHGPSCLDGPVARTLNRWYGKRKPTADSKRPHSESRSGESSPASSDVRTELVERIRREIAEGCYETPKKWEAAIELLFQRLPDG